MLLKKSVVCSVVDCDHFFFQRTTDHTTYTVRELLTNCIVSDSVREEVTSKDKDKTQK